LNCRSRPDDTQEVTMALDPGVKAFFDELKAASLPQH
jgi:hypothetical protein